MRSLSSLYSMRGNFTIEMAGAMLATFFTLFLVVSTARAVAALYTLDYIAVQTAMEMKYGEKNASKAIAKAGDGLELFVALDDIKSEIQYYENLASYPSTQASRTAGGLGVLTLRYNFLPELIASFAPSQQQLTLTATAVVRIEA